MCLLGAYFVGYSVRSHCILQSQTTEKIVFTYAVWWHAKYNLYDYCLTVCQLSTETVNGCKTSAEWKPINHNVHLLYSVNVHYILTPQHTCETWNMNFYFLKCCHMAQRARHVFLLHTFFSSLNRNHYLDDWWGTRWLGTFVAMFVQ